LRYGFIGLGHLGKHLAASLLCAGFDLTVYDLKRAAVDDLIERGAKWAPSPKDLAGAVDAVITCLPSPAASANVLTGDDGVLNGLRAGGTWIEMSSTDQHEIQRISRIAAARDIATLEAPVTGGVHRAAAGEITVLVGGDRAVYDSHRAALQAMGGSIFYMGELGKACVIKVITNMLAFIHLVAAGEAIWP
jgi:3-hydroxyisobutyrate dehydrogenase